MVQVDVFWSYGLASGLTLAASKKLKDADHPFENDVFPYIVTWLAVFFAPSGMYLLWNFPGWETMFVASDHRSIPAWLVVIFCITNITQGILGHYITYHFIKKGNLKAARWQPIWSHACMFLILFVGWDGTGFKRFTHTGSSADYHAGIHNPWYEWFTSPVCYTLLGMAIFLVPTYFLLCRKFLRED